MIKFTIVSRHKPESTRERYFYEWAFVHVSLMLHTAPSMRRFRRYVQHFANPDLPAEDRLLPVSAQLWESVAEHWIEKLETDTPGPEYVEQMLPHSFSDTAMEIWYLRGEVIFQREDFRVGGVKVLHRLARKPGVAAHEWERHLREVHAPLVLESLRGKGMRKYEINFPVPFDAQEFRAKRKGTLLEQADITPPAAVEEFWFDSLEAARQLGRDPGLRAAIGASYAAFIDPTKSSSFITNERVVFDFVSEAERSPTPAVLVPGSLESTAFKAGRPYHEPRKD